MTPKYKRESNQSNNIQWIKCGLQNIPLCHIQITQQSAQSTQNNKENRLSCVKRERKEAYFRAAAAAAAAAVTAVATTTAAPEAHLALASSFHMHPIQREHNSFRAHNTNKCAVSELHG